MEFAEFKTLVVKAAQELGIADYELYYQTSENAEVSTFRHEIQSFSSAVDGGVCFRCIVDGKMGYASTEALNEEEAELLVRRAADNAAVLETDDPVFLGEGGQSYQSVERTDAAMPGTDTLVELALKAEQAIYDAHPSVTDGCSAELVEERTRIAITNSKGLDLNYEGMLTAVLAQAVVQEGEELSDGYELRTGDLTAMDLTEIGTRAVNKARAKLNAQVPETAVCPVVFSPDAMADLLACYSVVFSAENAQKGLSKLQGKEGTVMASPAVTLVDDPFCPLSPLPMPFDAEGSPTVRKEVVSGGKLMTLLHNRKTAAKAGTSTTGNASKAGYKAPVSVRPFNFYLAPGEQSEEELLSGVERGVYIDSLGGLHAGANPISGDFSLQSGGFLIENGKKTVPVKSFTVAGNFYELLERITAVANDLKLPGATGVTNFGSPTVLVKELSIAGK